MFSLSRTAENFDRRLENMKPVRSILHKPKKNRLPLEDENADPVGKNSLFEEVEEAAERVENPAFEPVDRSAELLLQEADLTEAAIPMPAEKST
jgi:hypothetical protein